MSLTETNYRNNWPHRSSSLSKSVVMPSVAVGPAVDDHAKLGAAGIAGYYLGATTNKCHGTESVRGSPGWELHPGGDVT